MPLFELSVKSAVDCNVPPFNVRCPAVADPGADPNPLSAPIPVSYTHLTLPTTNRV